MRRVFCGHNLRHIAPADMDLRIANLRQEYARAELDEQSVSPDPIMQFKAWFNQAMEAGVVEPNAMTLSTADRSGRPSGRVILLKDVDSRGFSFFTNYRSRKADDLAVNPQAAMTFWWEGLERQVRVEGAVERLEAEASDLYFSSRPRLSQLGAWASDQSAVVASRDEIAQRFQKADERFSQEVPRPDHWGGYILLPDMIEFWQGRPGRLHDRIRYRREARRWVIERLAP